MASGIGKTYSATGSGKTYDAQAAGQAAAGAAALSGAILNVYDSAANVIPALSGEPSISALRCIVLRGGLGYVASSDDPACASVIAGLSITAATSLGAPFIVHGSGIVEDSAWSWLPSKPLFCGPDGRLTQTPPVSGFVQIVALPLSPTRLEISLQLPLKKLGA